MAPMAPQRETGRVPDADVDAPDLPSVPYLNVLAISRVPKTVPYQGTGVRRPDGGANYGFKNLKRHPELLDTIPEFASDPALRSIMAAIDRPTTGVFSIACLSKTITDPHGCRLSGYVEFALNGRREAADAANYFRLFHDFDRRLERGGFAEPVSFQWQIGPTRFEDVQADGFSVDVRIDTDYRPSAEQAYELWTRALAELERLLGSVPAVTEDPIYRVG
jgi:hypothetical protein